MKCLLCEKISLDIICKNCLATIPLAPTSRTLESQLKVYSFFEYSQISDLLATKYALIGSRIYGILARLAARYFFKNLVGLGADSGVDSEVLGGLKNVLAIPIDDRVSGERKGFWDTLGADKSGDKNFSQTAIIVREFCKIQAEFGFRNGGFGALDFLGAFNFFDAFRRKFMSEKLGKRVEKISSEPFFKPLYGVLHAQNDVRYAGKDLEFRKSNPRNFKLSKKLQNLQNVQNLENPKAQKLDSKLDFQRYEKFSEISNCSDSENVGILDSNLNSNLDCKVANFGNLAVIFDDIITTGATLSEAHRILRANGVRVLFALTLSDARF